MKNLISKSQELIEETKELLKAVPGGTTALFAVSVVLMNLLANKSVDNLPSWLALDCGFVLSWSYALTTDVVVKRFGARSVILLSLFVTFINLGVSIILFIMSLIPGTWGEYYTFNDANVNVALNNTFGGTWYVLLGSTIAFISSNVIDAIINVSLGKLFKKDNFTTFVIRSYGSTFFSQFADNFIFAIIVSYHFFGWSLLQCITCSFTGMLIELFCEFVFAPLGYRISKDWEENNVGSEYLNKYVIS